MKYKLQKINFKPETSLIAFLGYLISIVYLVFFGKVSFLTILLFHLAFVIFFSAYLLGFEFLMLLFAPLFAVIIPIHYFWMKRFINNFEENQFTEVVIVLGQPDWFKLEPWIKPIVNKGDLEMIVKYLEKKEQEFSFWPKASREDIKKIMASDEVKEVYFIGHGNSHTFQLSNSKTLYYCDFDSSEYQKEYVHQVHCGTPQGKSLVDYVVPENNRDDCFAYREKIDSYDIKEAFQDKIERLK